MIWKLLADLLVLYHVAACLFVVFGPLLVWRSPRGRIFHLAVVWGSTLMLIFYCPFTSLELSLRAHYDPRAAYAGGFVKHYSNMIVGWEPNMTVVKALEAFWGALWLILYLVFPARKKAPSPGT